MTRVLLLTMAILLAGCATLMNRATQGVANNLSAAILNQDDPETVRAGAPAFLLMLDGLIEGSPENADLLLQGAGLYGAYVGAFVEDPERAKTLANRAQDYAHRALCIKRKSLCEVTSRPFDEFAAELAKTGERDLPVLYGFGTTWATWIQVNADDWNAIAELPKVEATVTRVVELSDTYEDGFGHLYLAVLNTLRPPSLGGKPEVARVHFERAIAISEGRNLQAKVLFAENYGRMVFDQELHDRLVREVLEADPREPGFTLSNVLAQERAAILLADSAEYF